MTKFKIIPIFVVVLSLIFLGCIDQKQTGTPIPTATPTATPTAVPTVVATTPQPTPTPLRTQTLYIFDVDEYGFNKVTAINATASYENHTITINQGDTIKWVSVTDSGYYLTIVSKEALWNNSSSMLRYRFRAFNYTFSQPGEYEVYLKEFPREDHQKIIVNP